MNPFSRLVAFFRHREDPELARESSSLFAGHAHEVTCNCRRDRDGRYRPDVRCIALTRKKLEETRNRMNRRMNGG